MAKIFYTERDIDDLKARGVTSVDLTDNIVMTDLAVERALKHGIRINRVEQVAPKATFSPSVNLAVSSVHTQATRTSLDGELKAKIKSAVLARLNGQVDDALLDAVITRVLTAMK